MDSNPYNGRVPTDDWYAYTLDLKSSRELRITRQQELHKKVIFPGIWEHVDLGLQVLYDAHTQTGAGDPWADSYMMLFETDKEILMTVATKIPTSHQIGRYNNSIAQYNRVNACLTAHQVTEEYRRFLCSKCPSTIVTPFWHTEYQVRGCLYIIKPVDLIDHIKSRPACTYRSSSGMYIRIMDN